MKEHPKILGAILITVLFASAVFAVKSVGEHHIFDKLTAKIFNLNPVAITISENAGAHQDGVAEYTITTPSKSANYITCSDTGGCRLYLGETSITNGEVFTMVNVSANTVTVPEASGIRELSSDFAAGQYDSLTLIYVNDRWVELDEQNN